jgi:hypothetical protein
MLTERGRDRPAGRVATRTEPAGPAADHRIGRPPIGARCAAGDVGEDTAPGREGGAGSAPFTAAGLPFLEFDQPYGRHLAGPRVHDRGGGPGSRTGLMWSGLS